MKRMLCVCLSFLFAVFLFDAPACAQQLDLSAQAYVLYCVENDSIVLSKNANKRMKMASTTKIMTTLLALEQCKKNDRRVVFTESMMAEGSSMYLKVGDCVHLSDLAIGMMLCSGNDAANAVALTLGGSIENFSRLMNNKARELGLMDTNFVTPSGLDDENHYSTVSDMAYLMAYALKDKQFAEITKSRKMTVDFLAPQKSVEYVNHNRLLSTYEHCIGGKTGYTKSAGRCLVSASRKDNLTFVCVTFNAKDDWNDHVKMYDYGYERFASVDTNDSDDNMQIDVVGGHKNAIDLYVKNTPYTVVDIENKDKVERELYMPDFLYAPVKKGDFVGIVTYRLNGEIVAQNALFAGESVQRIEKKGLLYFFKRIF